MTLEIVRTERSYIVKDEKKTEQLCEKLDQARADCDARVHKCVQLNRDHVRDVGLIKRQKAELAQAKTEAARLGTALTDACATRDALARECNQLEADREYNAGLVEERDKNLAQARDFWYKNTLDAEAERDKMCKEAQEQSDLVRKLRQATAAEEAAIVEAAEALVECLLPMIFVKDEPVFYRAFSQLKAVLEHRSEAAAKLLERLATAELAAHVHDKACGELAQTVHTERAQRREAEQCDDASRLVIDGVHEALDECQIERNYDDGTPASLRTRVFWLNQRAERAEALATLVNERLAGLLNQLASNTQTLSRVADKPSESAMRLLHEDAEAARKLAAQIREALDDSQA